MIVNEKIISFTLLPPRIKLIIDLIPITEMEIFNSWQEFKD